MIPQETIQQIQSRIDIIEILGSFIKLKKRGSNYLGLCPFHNEKTPSFTVSPSKEIYKCFGCGRSGNTISFLMEHEKYTYVEALKWLASRYNIEIEEEFQNTEQRQQFQTAESLFIVNKFAQEYFSSVLFENEEGQQIGLGYLKERGFREDIIKKFQLGYCLENGHSFADKAKQAQYNAEILLKSGLVVQRDQGLSDNYRGRIIFPVHNQSGKVIGFGARLIKKNDKAPKYINTPENEIYVKSKLLYGMYFARQAIDKQNECLLVEGYTDVISLHQAGIENVVASGGTSLTPDQLRLIRKYTHNLTIVYDGDSAGIKAASRGLDLALEEGLNVKLILIPDNEDPDSYVQKIGTSAFREFVSTNKKDIILFQLEVALKDAGNDSQKKAQVVNQIAETISRINKAEDFTKQQDYIQRCADLLKIDESGLTSLVNKYIRERIGHQEFKNPVGPALSEDNKEISDSSLELLIKDELHEKALVRALLEYGLKIWDEESGQTVADQIFNEISENGLDELFDQKQLLEVIDIYKIWYEEGIEPTTKNFLYHENQNITQLVVSLIDNTSSELSPNWKDKYETDLPGVEQLYKTDVASSMAYLKLRKIKRLLIENQKDLANTHDKDMQINLLETQLHLKYMEKELASKYGIVILK